MHKNHRKIQAEDLVGTILGLVFGVPFIAGFGVIALQCLLWLRDGSWFSISLGTLGINLNLVALLVERPNQFKGGVKILNGLSGIISHLPLSGSLIVVSVLLALDIFSIIDYRETSHEPKAVKNMATDTL